ncbi:MAG: putative lipid II flippase FtsW [bacterium]|nr:putative lipid II flippase FtsW [bacterium]
MRSHRPDYIILLCLLFLVIFGLLALASASSNLGQAKFNDSFYYLKHQVFTGLIVGLAGFFLAYNIYYRRYQKFALILLLASIVLTALVFTPLGLKAGGAERWLQIGPITFQPAEFLKLTVIIYFAAWLAGQSERSRSFWKGFFPFFIVLGAVAGLLLKQPTTTTVVIISVSALVLYFVSGAKLSYVGGVAVIGVLALAVAVAMTPYRFQRIANFLNPDASPLGGGYHINQAQMAIGAGEIFGVGYGQSTTKISYLPEPIGDSIFAVVAEELGFVGSVGLVSVFLLLVLRILLLARSVKDKFGKLVLVGFGTLISLQVFINIGAISGLLPLTGVPLPFISYGGTALAVFMTMGGIVANISKHS